MTTPIKPCWYCGCTPAPRPDYVGFHLTCDSYDASWEGEETGWVSNGVPDVRGATAEEAIANWNAEAEDNAEEAAP